MYVRLGQIPSIVQPANPTPLNDAVLYPQSSTPFRVRRPGPQPVLPSSYAGVYPFPQPTSYNPYAIQPTGATMVGYDANGNPIYSNAVTQPATVTATVSATPGSLTAWLQTGNNGIYAAVAAAVLILLLMRRR